ncbi:hypothetical protein QAD02_005865 [Eretmocerus hayati]|uniref:Uncharacterized protein n=1 Tax=Eretmocerus hayati TaxID=131215 RepID=A0ACC2NTQ9_9HYME|nr:hypothetical protein QAD02_005865 [Eretmocerus hayati]
MTYFVHDLNFDYECLEIPPVNLYICFLKSFRSLFKELRSDKVKFVTTMSTAHLPEEYKTSLHELEELIAEKISVAHAVRLTEDFVEAQDEMIIGKVTEIVGGFIKPIYYVAVFLTIDIDSTIFIKATKSKS